MKPKPTLSVVVGTKIPKDAFEETIDVSHPKIIDGMDNDLVALNGGQYQHNSIVVGEIVYHYNGYEEPDSMIDLISRFSSRRSKVKERLEKQFGIDREVSIYLVGECR